MSSGGLLLGCLVLFLVLWGIIDAIIWILGYQTASQLIIEKKDDPVWRASAVVFCAVITVIGLWLFFHWELL